MARVSSSAGGLEGALAGVKDMTSLDKKSLRRGAKLINDEVWNDCAELG